MARWHGGGTDGCGVCGTDLRITLKKLPIRAVNRGTNYPLIEMVFVALCGAICDCNTWTDVADFGEAKLAWFRKFLPFEKGIPSHDTFTEVFARLDTVEFYAALESWAQEMARSLHGETVAFDGKTLRGSFDQAAGKSALHSVSAWACGLKMCIALKSVADKSNEIPAVQQLIDLLDLSGAVVTADAMHCQRETAEKIIAKDADYVLMVKGNQETLQAAVQEAMMQAFEAEDPQLRRCRKSEKNRDRRETREVAALPVPEGFGGVSPLARRENDRQHLSQPGDRRQAGGIAGVLHQQPALQSARDQPTSAFALEHRELAAPCAGCNFYRRLEPHSQRERPGNYFRVSPARTQHFATRHFAKRKHPRQTQTLRLG